MKRIFICIAIISLLVSEGCQKSCDIPGGLGAQICIDRRYAYTGIYNGNCDITFTGFSTSQYQKKQVMLGTSGPNSIVIPTLGSVDVNERGEFRLDSARIELQGYHFIATGSGYFFDTLLYYRITYLIDSTFPSNAANPWSINEYSGVR